MAPDGMDMAHCSEPAYSNWGVKWEVLMAWALNQQYGREKLTLGPGGFLIAPWPQMCGMCVNE